MLKFPEDNARFRWTRHIKNKMVYYNLSANYLLRIFRTPQRREEGIAPGTIGAMKTRKRASASRSLNNESGIKNRNQRDEEIWIMYKLNAKRSEQLTSDRLTLNKKRSELEKRYPQSSVKGQWSKVVMISAWRYPGKTKPGERPPVPEGLIEELTREGVI